ncbi:MAG TPA: flagellin hook IN motif-containing protein [Acidimicrobiia bacterium]|nr:flagellin hook IN motif-containing protein [Acidimicrobiia bacterium]
MQIGASSASTTYALWGGGPLRVTINGASTSEPAPKTSETDLRSLRSALVDLQKSIAASAEALGSSRSLVDRVTSPARAVSTTRLGLENTSTFSNIVTEPVVGRFGTVIPETAVFGSTSTAYPTIGGEYNGTVDEVFTFRVKSADGTGQVGTDRIELEVTNSAGELTDRIVMQSEAPGTEFTLSSGLAVSFADGTMNKNEVFRVSATAGDPGAPTTTNPSFEGGSTSSPTVGGVYTGGTSDDVLTVTAIEVSRTGQVGRDQVTFSVTNSAGVQLETFRIRREAPGTQFTLSSGVTLAFGAGNIVQGDSFSFGVTGREPGTTNTTTPQFEGASSSATLGGEYGGDDDVLTFTIVDASGRGIVGQDQITIEVTNSAGELVDTFTSHKEAPGTPFQLSNGVTIALGEGSVAEGGFFTLPVSAPGNGLIKPDNPFNGTGALDPAFADGVEVVAGSFTVNGVQIDVAADDSVTSVLAKITASAAGVRAWYDEATQQVTVEATTAGPVDIEFGADSSGFLAAVNLAGAPVNLGVVGNEADVAMAEVDEFASVTAGIITINGVDITIDPTNDSVQDVVDRINESDAGVRASVSGSSFQLLGSTGSDLVISSGTTGFFAAVHIVDGIYAPRESKVAAGAVLPSGARKAADAFTDVTNAFESVFTRLQAGNETSEQVRDALENAVARFNSYRDGARARTRFGLTVDVGNDTASLSTREFTRALRRDPANVEKTLFGSPRREGDGLFGEISEAVDAMVSELDTELGALGSFVDVSA